MAEIILILGAARSGKSRFAERLAASFGQEVLYVATMVPIDDETRARIQEHRSRRPVVWSTREAPLEVADVLAEEAGYDARLVDCITLWVSNQILAHEGRGTAWADIKSQVLAEADRLLAGQVRHSAPLLLVSNEVGGGIVPDNPLARGFRDILGEVNQVLARHANRFYALWAGQYIELKSAGARSVEEPPE